jgi:hypothetical protein
MYEYYVNEYPDKEADVRNYVERLRAEFISMKQTLTNLAFKKVYLFLQSTYNIMITNFDQIEELQRYSDIHWVDKNNPREKLVRYLSYYTIELPDYTTLLTTNERGDLVETEEYNNLINTLNELNLNKELEQIMRDERLQELLIDVAILSNNGVEIQEIPYLSNLISYAEYLGLKRILEDFEQLNIPGLKEV